MKLNIFKKKTTRDKLYEELKPITKVLPEGLPQYPLPLFGIECRTGWDELILKLVMDIKEHIREMRKAEPNYLHKFRVTQIKEKFGGLSFYIEGGDEAINMLISEASSESYKTCELCGTKEDIGRTKGWLTTVCRKCHANDKGRVGEREWKPLSE